MPKGVGHAPSKPVPAEDFLQFLVTRGALPEARSEHIREESERTGRSPLVLIAESGILSEEEAYRLRGEFLGVPFFSIAPDTKIPPELFLLIPEEAAKRYQVVPLGREGFMLDVGMLAPEDSAAQDALRFLATREGIRTRIFLITASAFQGILNQYRPFRGEVAQALTELERILTESEEAAPETRRGRGAQLLTEAPIIKMVAVFLRQAVEGNASDLHIEPGHVQMRVRFRVDGILYTSLFLPMSVHPAIIARLKILSQLKIDETRLAQDGRFRANFDGKEIDFRVATLPTALGEKVAIRLLDPAIGLKTLSELGLVGRALRDVQEAVAHPFGVILITGPTGSGKTTTLYAMLQEMKRDAENIVTLEDPVEYYVDGVNQSQVNEEIGYTFASGLRHILRGDPNIIMVGEIRDRETAKLAVHAGLTGHVVLSTLHTNNALGAIPRLIDLGVDHFLISPTLLLVVAQRLVQHLCPDCKTPRAPLPRERERIVQAISELPEEERAALPEEREWKVWDAPGCEKCRGRGMRGRIAVFETLRMTRELGELILTTPSSAKIADEARRQGIVTMFQDGIRKVLEGSVSFQELLRVVEESEDAEMIDRR